MKTHISKLSLPIITALMLAGCGGSTENNTNNDDESGTRLLEKSSNLNGVISPVKDVDWYTIDVKEAGIISVNIYNETFRYDVDILATIYEEDEEQELVRLAADHFPEESSSKSALSINVNVTEPKKLFVAVRDLDDDDSSSTETYTISYDTAEPEDNNGTFESAVNLELNGSCHQDNIGTVGDTDVMRFTVSQSGVYKLDTTFQEFGDSSSVDLKTSLFDSDGTLIRNTAKSEDNVYRLVENLVAGEYFLLVYDQGKDNFDTSSNYKTCLTSVDSGEVLNNDTQETASAISGDGFYTISGSLDYSGDEDWSRIDSGADPVSIQVLQIEFDPSDSNGCNSWFLLEVKDSNDKILFSKEYSTETGLRTSHVKVETSGEHFINVKAIDEDICALNGSVGMAYDVTLTSVDVDDDAEKGEGNNKMDSATELDETLNTAVEARLSYAGDVDWYRVTVPADHQQDRIIEIFIESENPTPLEYYINILESDNIYYAHAGNADSANPFSFKKSYFIPKTEGNTNTDYFIKVVDLQSDEADINNPYFVRTNIVPVASSAPASAAQGRITDADFFYESEEQERLSAGQNVLTLALDTGTRYFSFNDDAFSLSDDEIETQVSITEILVEKEEEEEAEDGVTEGEGTDVEEEEYKISRIDVTFPWQSGFIDYDGDQDWFKLPIMDIFRKAGGDAAIWYVEIQLELYSPGSIVEYSWGIYRDSRNDQMVQAYGGNGLFGSAGDTSSVVSEFDHKTPGNGSGPMWLNYRRGGENLYLTITDIGVSNTVADNDWAYDQPYYTRLKLIYHMDKANP